MPCYSPLRGYKSRYNGGLTFKRSESIGEKLTVPCGGCLGCRLDKSRVWAIRMSHEAELHEENCFITLTYRDRRECDQEQCAKGYFLQDPSLHPDHLKKFIKSLRNAGHKLRYYGVGEYGDLNLRPHYHVCLFGYRPADLQPVARKAGYTVYEAQSLGKHWPFGFSQVGELNYATAAYTARYVLKKQTGLQADKNYERVNPETGEIIYVHPEFCRMSRRPGIGAKWYEKYKNDLFPADHTPVRGKPPVPSVPRYYGKLHEQTNPEEIDEIKKVRRAFFKAHGDDYTPERLMDRYNVKKAQIKSLKRSV